MVCDCDTAGPRGASVSVRPNRRGFYPTVLYVLILDGPAPDSNAAIVLTFLKHPAVLSRWNEHLQCEFFGRVSL